MMVCNEMKRTVVVPTHLYPCSKNVQDVTITTDSPALCTHHPFIINLRQNSEKIQNYFHILTSFSMAADLMLNI